MILRKPYAFLIKNFKNIHLILFLLTTFIIYKTNQILMFFNNYIKDTATFYSDSLANEYISSYMYISSLLVLALSIIIYILMRQKEKPTKLYLFMMIVYLLLPIVFFIDSNYLNVIQFNGLEPRIVRILRDTNFIATTSQIFFVLFILVRAVGFDIRKFNFGEDIESLKIDVTDDEEFELTSGVDIDKIGRKYRGQRRELKYFYIENKSVILGILVTIIIGVFGFFYFQNQILNKVHKQLDVVNIDDLYFKINNVYSTKLNYRGVDISEKGYTYVVVDLNVNNKSKINRKVNIDNLRIVVGNNIYAADITKYAFFLDMGDGYYNQVLESKDIRNYIFVYKVKDEDINQEMILRYADKLKFNKSGSNTRYTRYEIQAESLDKITIFDRAELGKTIYYGLSFAKKTTLKLNSIDFKDKYEYKVNDVITYIKDIIGTNTVMKIGYEFELDPSITYINNFKGFIDKFGEIKYKINDKVYTAPYSNLTPSGYADNDVYLSVNKKILEASSIDLVINVRNKRYIYTLK